MKRFFFAVALMAAISLGGLAIESASAQNNNNNMERHDMGQHNMGRRGRLHRRGRHNRWHRRHGMHKTTGNANM